MSQYLNMPVLAVGAAFDYHSGLLQEPPQFVQQAGLQWLYPLCQVLGRLLRRLDDTRAPLADVRFG
jgi:N-acetylglucosaminyldiphosphoundecaprenol N-acetyl-beta-D-mannosaminyltransferase